MVEINDLMKDCLIRANNDFPDIGYIDTVIEAFREFITLTGSPVEFEDDDEAEDYLKRCVGFVVDCNLWNMLEKGVMEIEGMDEDGELVYKITAEF